MTLLARRPPSSAGPNENTSRFGRGPKPRLPRRRGREAGIAMLARETAS